ncbi:MAG: ribonuclease H-like domain-containing protein [Candidatus Omnitrophica bacterium]|nr:ribonuclease H-like domain-containing protein [Candidatus Omnitrophota bacterium]
MSKIVFDIETVGDDFDSYDTDTQELLLKNAQTEEENQEVRDGLGLSPVTGKIVAIAMVDVHSDEGVVFFQSRDGATGSFREGNGEYIVCSEKEILENFWDKISDCSQFITYNGRGFDCPYIMIRSAALKVKPTRDLMPYRYDSKTHVDLYDQLTCYGAMRRHFSLHMVSQAFGIRSPKQEGISGAMVGDLFQAQKTTDIARYCLRDVRATKQVYLTWEKYIKPGKKVTKGY